MKEAEKEREVAVRLEKVFFMAKKMGQGCRRGRRRKKEEEKEKRMKEKGGRERKGKAVAALGIRVDGSGSAVSVNTDALCPRDFSIQFRCGSFSDLYSFFQQPCCCHSFFHLRSSFFRIHLSESSPLAARVLHPSHGQSPHPNGAIFNISPLPRSTPTAPDTRRDRLRLHSLSTHHTQAAPKSQRSQHSHYSPPSRTGSSPHVPTEQYQGAPGAAPRERRRQERFLFHRNARRRILAVCQTFPSHRPSTPPRTAWVPVSARHKLSHRQRN